jgi:uncharacterized integral membrane protein
MASDGRGADSDHHDHLAKVVLIAILVALLVAFTLGNSERVRVSFVFFHVRSSLIWVLLITNLLGFLAGVLVNGRVQARRARRVAEH